MYLKKEFQMFSLFKNIFSAITDTPVEINPANGIPIIDNTNIDISGSFYGFSNDTFNDWSNSSLDNSGLSSFD
jgi:hypothetical protein